MALRHRDYHLQKKGQHFGMGFEERQHFTRGEWKWESKNTGKSLEIYRANEWEKIQQIQHLAQVL